MGAFAVGFGGALADKAKQVADQSRQKDMAMKDAQAAVYWNVFKDPNADDTQRQYATEQLKKIYGGSKPLKDLFDKFHGMVAHAHSGGMQAPPQAGGGAAPPPQAGATPPPTPGDTSAGSPEVTGAMSEVTPAGGSSTAPPGTAAAGITKPMSYADFVKSRQGIETATAQRASDASFEDYKRKQKLLADLRIQEDQAKEKAKADQRVGSTRPTNIGALSVRNAKTLAQQGKVYQDLDGNGIDLSQLDDQMGLKSFTVRTDKGTEMRYEPFSPNQKVITVGNETYSISPMDVSGLTQGEGTDLGVHNVPSTSVRTAIGVDAQGNPVFQQLPTTKTPTTPGAKGRGAMAAPPQATGTTGPTPTSGAGGGKAPTGAGAGGSASGGGTSKGGPPAKPQAYMTPGMYNTQTTRVVPVREAATQVFGDPTQPQLKSLKDYASIADDPQSRQRLATALNLTFDGLDAAEKQSGSLWELLKLHGGVPQALASARAGVRQDVMKALTPQEQDAYDAIMSTYGAVIGLRSLTKASAAQFSIKKLENEVPLPGINSMNSRQYYDQLARLAEQVYNGTRSISTQVMPQSEKDYYKSQVPELLKLKSGGGKMQPPPKMQPKTAEEYLKQAH